MPITEIQENGELINNLEAVEAEDMNLLNLFYVIFDNKWLILFIVSIFSTCSLLYAFSIQNEYKSTAILIPASNSGSSSISNLAGQFGGLASLAGINLGGSQSVDKTVVALELLKTWGFLDSYIKDNNLEVNVLALNGWNREGNRLTYDETIYNVNESEWVGELSNVGPSSWELFKKIKERIKISQDKVSGIITLSVTHYSPFIAKEWVDSLIVAINKHVQFQDRKEALNNIKYLKEQINNTNVSEMRTIFYQLIEEQTKKLMLAEISSEYVFKTLSQARVAEEKTRPKRVLIVILGALLGCILGTPIALIRHFIENKNC